MAEPENFKFSENEFKDLKSLWTDAFEAVKRPPAESTAQALAFGVNLRIHLGHALLAAWETSKAVVKGTAAAHAPFAFWLWAEVAADAVGAAYAIFSSLVQRMRPIDYITCVILSVHSKGLSEAELRQAVEEFLNDPRASEYAWHFAMSEARVHRAKEVLGSPQWFSGVLVELEKADFLERHGDTIKFKSHNYEIGWTPE
jgi:hypothetical protein